MNINDFNNKLNPNFLAKGYKLYLDSLEKTSLQVTGENNYVFDSYDRDKKFTTSILLRNDGLIADSKCNCKERNAICTHQVATLYAIKDHLVSKTSTVKNLESPLEKIKELPSLTRQALYIKSDVKSLEALLVSNSLDEDCLFYYFNSLVKLYGEDLMVKEITTHSKHKVILALLFKYLVSKGISTNLLLKEHFDLLKDDELFLNIVKRSYLQVVINLLIFHYFTKDDPLLIFLKKIGVDDKLFIFKSLINILNHNYNTFTNNEYFDFLNDKEVELPLNHEIILTLRFNLYHPELLIKANVNYLDYLKYFSFKEILKSKEAFKLISKDLIPYIEKTLASSTLLGLNSPYNAYLIIKEIVNKNIFEVKLSTGLLYTLLSDKQVREDLDIKTDGNYLYYFDVQNGLIYTYELHGNILKTYDYSGKNLDKKKENDLMFYDQSIDKHYQEYLKLIELRREEINKIRNQKLLESLNVYLNEEVKEHYSLHLIPNFYLDRESLNLRLRVKIDEETSYITPPLKNFFELIKNKENFSFSKKVNVNLAYENFDDKSKFLLDEIMNNKVNNLLCEISEESLARIIKSYQGEHVELFNLDYLITSTPLTPTIYLDENKLLKINQADDNYFFIPGKIFDLLINANDKTINTLHYKDVLHQKITRFILTNEGLSLDSNEHYFNDNIYPLIREYISLPKEYLTNYKIKEFIIHSYFDFIDNQVQLTSKFFLDDLEISSIPKVYSQNYKNYEDVLSSLNITNGKITNLEDLVTFLKSDLSELKSISKVFISEKLAKLTPKNFEAKKNTFKVAYKNSMLTIDYVNEDYNENELKEILKAYHKKQKFVLLNDNLIDLTADEIKDLVNFLDDFNIDEFEPYKESSNPMYKILNLKQYLDSSLKIEYDNTISLMLNDIKNYKTSKFPLKDELRGLLRPYQEEGFNWMMTLNKYGLGGVLADDMGLGKTLQAICLLDASAKLYPSLIICPKSLIYNWENEFIKFKSSLKPIIYEGDKLERVKLLEEHQSFDEVLIVSYDTLRNDLEEFKKYQYNYIILDEAQVIKNVNTLKTRSTKALKSLNKLVLTGTPLENSASDLWSIFDFLMSGYLYSYQNFKNRIEKGLIEGDDDCYNHIKSKVAPFILRRRKSDVLDDLPKKSERVITLNMMPEQEKIYAAHLMNAQKKFNGSQKVNYLEVLTTLRQICISPYLASETYSKEASKIEYAVEMIKNLTQTNHKVLLFSQFTSALDLIREKLLENDISYYYLDGKTSSKTRLEMCKNFNEDESSPKVFLISLKAGGVGLNLTGSDSVILLDPWWNYASEEQASDRAHRIGQKHKVTVFKLIMKDTIEEKVIKLQQMKKEIADRIISKDDSAIANLNINEFEYLLF